MSLRHLRFQNFKLAPSLLIALLLSSIYGSAHAALDAAGADKSVNGKSAYPIASDPDKVGSFPALVKSGAGFFYDEVL